MCCRVHAWLRVRARAHHVLAFDLRSAGRAWASIASLGIVLRVKQPVPIVSVLVALAVPVIGAPRVVQVHV